jgi:hypothetical protein
MTLLVGRRMTQGLTVRIVSLPDLNEKKNLLAQVDTDEVGHARDFTVMIDFHPSRRKYLMSLAHEMVHIKQYARGQLGPVIVGKTTRWMGERVDEERTHYYDLPWEIEAFGREEGMIVRYEQHLRDDGVSF